MKLKSIIYFTIAMLAALPASQAMGLDDLSDTRIRSAERLERVMPIEKLAESMIVDHASTLLPINAAILASSIRKDIDWKVMREKNIQHLAARLSTDELDYLAGENMSKSDMRSGIVKAMMLPETKAMLRAEIEKATQKFESLQAQKLGGFDIKRQSFLEYQAKNGIYYYPVIPLTVAQYAVPTYNNFYYSRMVK
jgi:hypothetical protein